MGRYLLAVHTRPVRGMEREYHDWYDGFHLDEVLRLPEFAAAERCELLDADPTSDLGRDSHLALFTVETDDIDATMTAFREAQKTMREPPCLDTGSVRLSWWHSLLTRDAPPHDSTVATASSAPTATGPGHPRP